MAVFVQVFFFLSMADSFGFISSRNIYCSNITFILFSLYPMSVAALRNILRSRKKPLLCFTGKKGNNNTSGTVGVRKKREHANV